MGAEPALIRMLRAGQHGGGQIDQALDALAQVFSRRSTTERLASRVTCEEANILAWVFIASRHTDTAIGWIDQHAAHDTDQDLHGGADFDAARYLNVSRTRR